MKRTAPKASGTGGSAPSNHATRSGSRPGGGNGPKIPSSAPTNAKNIRGK